jgi:glutathione synthase/RimK-type ligase-like ATP-grasp enzyme
LSDLQARLTSKHGYLVQTADIQHTVLQVVAGEARVLVNMDDDVKNFDMVVFRNASQFGALAAPVCLYLDHHQIPYINGMDGSAVYIGKIAQMFLFALNGLPVVDSLVVRNPHALKDYLPNFLAGQAMIVKDNDGIKGRRNFLVSADYDLEAFLAERREIYIIQPYITNDGDYRILFAGTDQPPLIFKRTKAADSHLNNTSQGGSAQVVTDFPDAALATARAGAKLFGRELAGVDILFDGQDNHFILEVNETPAVASGFIPEAKIDLLHKYINSVLEP